MYFICVIALPPIYSLDRGRRFPASLSLPVPQLRNHVDEREAPVLDDLELGAFERAA